MDYLYIGLVISIFTVSYIEVRGNSKQIREINSRIDKIAEHIGLDELTNSFVDNELKTELSDLINKGKKIEAIKLLRKNTGMQLIDAKEYVDKL